VPPAPLGKWEFDVAKQLQQRSALSVGFEVASRVTAVGLGFSVPPVLGYALDRWWGSTPVATLVGMVLGFVSGLLQTVRLAKDLPGGKSTASRGAAPKTGPSVSTGNSDQENHSGQKSQDSH
jgi:F0F1-type ATP synthase assembly protein I